MKDFLKDLNKAFENKIRLGIMAVLLASEYTDFNSLKEILEVTDGNLASHLKTLERNGYITVQKEFLERKSNTKYFVTSEGKEAFIKHINAIEQLIR